MSALVNGVVSDCIETNDRGLAYGDGVFETILVENGGLRLWSRHLERLKRGLERLQISFDAFDSLQREAEELAAANIKAVLKMIVTRGSSRRGYRFDSTGEPTRILSLSQAPETPPTDYRDGILTGWCETRLGINPQLAGIKHLNRLEQVLARAEWSDSHIAEGLMCDIEGRVVEATASNLFLHCGNTLATPSLDRCGVAGVMRGLTMELARQAKIDVIEKSVSPDDVSRSDGLFLTNAITGIRPVRGLRDSDGKETRFNVHPLTRELMQAARKVQ